MAAREDITEHVKLQKLRCDIFKFRIDFEFILLHEVKWPLCRNEYSSTYSAEI